VPLKDHSRASFDRDEEALDSMENRRSIPLSSSAQKGHRGNIKTYLRQANSRNKDNFNFM
jgi:hypothetical protein